MACAIVAETSKDNILLGQFMPFLSQGIFTITLVAFWILIQCAYLIINEFKTQLLNSMNILFTEVSHMLLFKDKIPFLALPDKALLTKLFHY